MRRRRGHEGMPSPAAGAILLVLIVIVVFFGFTKTIPFRHHYKVSAVFQTSNNIRTNSPVRIAGIEVGRVTDVKAAGKGVSASVVTMELKDNAKPLHQDATAKIRPRIFLEGNFFVDLSPGTPSAPKLKEGETIPINQTSTPVQFDQVLSILRSDTRGDLRRALAELATSQKEGAAGFNRSWEFQPDAYKFSAIVAEAALGQRPHDLSAWVRDMGIVSAALDRDPAALKNLLTDFNITAGALASEESNLQAAVQELPRTLIAAKPAFDSLNRAFPPTRTLARVALPGVRSSGPALDAALPLTRQLRGLVSIPELRGLSGDLRNTIPSLVQLANASVPLLTQARLASSCQNEVILPWTKQTTPDRFFPATGPVFEEGVKFLPGLAGESRSFDANGQWFKVLGTGGLSTFDLGNGLFGTGLFPLQGTNPPKPPNARRPPLRPDVPCETQEVPDLGSTPIAPPPQVAKVKSKAATQRYAAAREVAIDTLKAQLVRSGSPVKVLDRDVTAAQLVAQARRNGTLDEVRKLTGVGK